MLLGENGYTPTDVRAMGTDGVYTAIGRLLQWPVSAPRVPDGFGGYRQTRDVNEMVRWIGDRSGPHSVVYFVGDLPRFRIQAGKQIQELQTLEDNARPSRARPTGETFELAELQRKVELVRIAQKLADSGDIMLAQRPDPDLGMIYLATKRTSR